MTGLLRPPASGTKPDGTRASISSLTPEQRVRLEQRLAQRALDRRGEDAIERSGDGPRLLSPGQERLWFIDRLEPNTAAYNLAWALRLKGSLNVEALQSALNRIVARHEPLRTVFREVEGVPHQFVRAARPVEMVRVDLSNGPDEPHIQEVLSQEARRRFHLESDQLLRSALLCLGPDEHILLLTLHHISADGWSRSILLGELSALYTSVIEEKEPKVPELSVSYADFAQWQRRYLAGNRMDASLAYWKHQLAGAPAALSLATDFPRPSFQSYRGARESLALDAALASQLKDLSQREQSTLFMTLLGAFQILLHRYTGDSDIVVGTPLASRRRVETEGLIGFFVNTVALRADLSGSPTFRQMLSRVREVTLGAFAHQDVPFERLVNSLRPSRETSHSPIFQVMFVLLNAPGPIFDPPGLSAEVVDLETGASQFDLVMEVVDKPGQLILRLAYCTDLFAAETVKRLLTHYETLLRSVVANPDLPISRIPLLPDAERQSLLVKWNPKETEFPQKTALELFAEQVEIAPQGIAVSHEDRAWTYAELAQHSDRIAHHLTGLGVGPGGLVGICVERSMEMLAALLGIWKAGAAYLPLDPAYPKPRLAFILEDAQPVVVLTEARLRAGLPETSAKVALLEDCSREVAVKAVSEASLEGLAYVLYTSGSTGKPKGVAIGHRSLTNLLHSMAARLEVTSRDVMLAITTISFDIAGLELFLPLTIGARVAVVSREVAVDGRRLSEAMESMGVTIAQGTPATWEMLLDSGWQVKEDLKILCGGEALPPALAQRLRVGGRLWNVYGPTETTIWSSAARLSAAGSEVSIGQPLDNTTFYVLDTEMQLVPIGVPGELYIGGAGLAEGYWKRPELTAEKFVRDPFSSKPAARLYRTGDLVRYRLDGSIEFRGRIDSQVKIRGFRIELGEIETVLGGHPAVRQCAAVAREDQPGNKALIAYVETRPGSACDVAELRAQLKKELPEYMVPSAFVRLDKLPLTPSGKIDRQALPNPEKQPSEQDAAFVPPRDAMEETIASIWAKILRVERLGLHDDFFELGGHSLTAVRMLYEIRKATGRNLPLATLLRASTVQALAAVMREDKEMGWTSLVPMQPQGNKPPLFLVHGAEGNVLLYRPLLRHLEPDQPVFGLQSQGLNGEAPEHTTIPAMASHYVQEILTIQPDGPYYLAGYCLGGSIAYETARQLTAIGKRVELVGLIESHNSNFERHSKIFLQSPRHFLQNLWFHFANAWSLGPRERPLFLHEKIDIEIGRLRQRLRAAWFGDSQAEKTAFPHLALKKMNDAAAKNYRPLSYRGRVAVIRPKAYFAGLASPSLGWDESVEQGVEIHELPVYPKGMLVDPFCRSLARTLTQCMRRAREADNAPVVSASQPAVD